MPRLPRKPDEPLGSLSSVALSCSSVKQLHCITEWWLVIQRYSCCPNQGEHFTPATALSGGDFRVAGCAERHEVRFIVRTALRQRDDVVYLLRRSDLATLIAPLAQRVSSDETVAHTLPRPAVALLHGRVTLEAFVSLGFQLGVLLAEASVGKPWAARVGAGSLGSAGHCGHLHGHRKGAGFLPLLSLLLSIL